MRRHEQKSLLNEGASLLDGDVERLVQSLLADSRDLKTRFKLIGYFVEKYRKENRYFGAPADVVLFNQMAWLMQNNPALPLFSTVTAAYHFFDREQRFEVYKIVLDTLKAYEHSEELLINALIFIGSCDRDRELEIQLENELKQLRSRNDN